MKEAARTKLPDPGVDTETKRKVLEDLILTFEPDELMTLFTALGAFMQIDEEAFPKGCENIPWEVMLDSRNQNPKLKDLAVGLYFDRARPENTREKALEYLVKNHWAKVEERVWTSGIDFPWLILRRVHPRMDWKEAKRYLQLHGHRLISSKKSWLGPNFFPILNKSGITLWEIIKGTDEEEMVVACLSLFQNHHRGPKGVDYSGLYQEMLDNWIQLLKHPSPEVRSRTLEIQRKWRWPNCPPKPDLKVLNEAYGLELTLQDDGDSQVRASALAAVIRYHGEPDWSRINNVLNSGEPVEREAVIGALEYMVATGKLKEIDDEFFPWVDAYYRKLLEEGDDLMDGIHIYQAFPERRKELESLIVDFAPSPARRVQWRVSELVLWNAEWFPWKRHREVFWQTLLESDSRQQGGYARLFGFFKEEQYFKKMRKQNMGMNAIGGYLAKHKIDGTLGLMLKLFRKSEYGIHRGDIGQDLIRAILKYSKKEIMDDPRLTEFSKYELVKIIGEYGHRYANGRKGKGGWVAP